MLHYKKWYTESIGEFLCFNLFSFIPANKDHDIDQLKLALAWNRIDVAKTDIFTEDKKWEVNKEQNISFNSSVFICTTIMITP